MNALRNESSPSLNELKEDMQIELLRSILCENIHKWKHTKSYFKRSSQFTHGRCRYELSRRALK